MILRQKFARDLIEPVPKGEFGGDLIQRVMVARRSACWLHPMGGQAAQELERRLAQQAP